MKIYQETVKNFDEARGWGNSWDIKDLCLNLTEEIGELWNLIKWVDVEKQKQIIKEHKEEVSDFIGDSIFLLLKIANQTEVDVGESLSSTLQEYERRMPADEIKKVGHGNILCGGIDKKDGRRKEN